MSSPVNLQANFFADNPNAQGPFSTLGGAVTAILPNIIVFAGVLFFGLIIYGGFQLITLGGQYNLNSEKVTKAKQMTYYAVIGFLLVISAYFILQLISTVTGINFINPPVT